MIHVSELLDVAQLEKDIANKMIGTSKHPYLPLTIYCYTNATQFKQYWTRETMVCRGLILDDDGFVVARGPSKFFNYGQKGAPEFSLDDKVLVTDKRDGSLGIVWKYKGEVGIATKGSFVSPQAIKATSLMTQIHKMVGEKDEFTFIYEIVYPEGRIVLDYGMEEKLYHLGTVDNVTGTISDRDIDGDLVLNYNLTVRDALALPPRSNAEGLVLDIQTKDGTVHLKVKQEDYKRLHAIVTGTSERNLWVYLVAEKFQHLIKKPQHWGSIFLHDVEAFTSVIKEGPEWRQRLFDAVPDEFEEWVHRTLNRLETEANFFADLNIKKAEKIALLPDREQFEVAQNEPYVTEIMRYIRNGDVDGIYMRAWRDVQPRGVCRPFSVDE